MPESETISSFLQQATAALRTDAPAALTLAEQAMAMAAREQDGRESARAGRVRGQALRSLGRHADALDAFAGAADAARSAGDRRLAAQVQLGSIDSLGMLGRYEEGTRLADTLEQELRAVGAETEAAKALVNAGSLHFRRDRYAEALTCYLRAETLLEPNTEAAMRAYLQTNCANILTLLHREEEAVVLYETARAALQDSPPDLAVVELNLGSLHALSGRYTQALAAYTGAYQTFLTTGREQQAARCAVDRAEVYRALNLFPESLEDYAYALLVFERLPVEYDTGRAEIGQAIVLLALGRTAEATDALTRAESLFRAPKNRLQQAHIRLLRAGIFVQAGDETRALREARAAERVFQASGLPDWTAEARGLIASLEIADGKTGIRSLHSVARVARQYGRGWLACRAERTLARHYLAQNRVALALRHFRAAVESLEDARTLIVSEEMHLPFLRDKLEIYEDIVGLLLTRGKVRDIAEALEYVERARSRLLLERLARSLETETVAPVAQRGSVPPEVRERLARLRAELSREYQRLNPFPPGEGRRFAGETAETGRDLLPLEAAYRMALDEAALLHSGPNPVGGTLSPVVTVKDLQAALPPQELLVEYYTIGKTLWVFLLGAERIEVRRLAVSVDEVLYLQRKLRFHLQRLERTQPYRTDHAGSFLTGFQDTLQRLYDALLRPLEAALDTPEIVLIPYGPLHGLPFHALYDGSRYALDRWEFVYSPGASVWYSGRQAAQHRRDSVSVPALLMALPQPGMEQVTEEVEHLAGILPDAKVFQKDAATLAAFRQWAPVCDPIHLATHALFRPDNPLFSGLRFAEDWLLARDLYETTLDCDLVTLSACSTGVLRVEAGDEIFGLVRGFLVAGARSVLASLWAVDDAATARWMITFYTCRLQGMKKAAAARTAAQSLRDAYPHPYYWAAFALIGER